MVISPRNSSKLTECTKLKRVILSMKDAAGFAIRRICNFLQITAIPRLHLRRVLIGLLVFLVSALTLHGRRSSAMGSRWSRRTEKKTVHELICSGGTITENLKLATDNDRRINDQVLLNCMPHLFREFNFRCTPPSSVNIWPKNGCSFAVEAKTPRTKEDIRTNSHELPNLLILIPSVVRESLRRRVVRATWGAKLSKSFRTIFVVANAATVNEQEKLKFESERYGDILQFNLVDNYQNFTRKVYDMLNWASSHCKKDAFVMKADSDTLILHRGLEKFMSERWMEEQTIFSKCGWRMNLYPVRDKMSKWYVGTDMWKCTRFPSYCTGNAYLMSAGVPARLTAALVAHRIPVSWHVEDVIFTGLLPHLTRGVPVRRRNHDGFFAQWDSVCGKESIVMNLEGVSDQETVEAWRRYQRTCSLNSNDR